MMVLVMGLVLFIVGLIAISALCVAAINLWDRFTYARNLARYDNYDRILSAQDEKFLKQAESDFEALANVKNPKWYGPFISIGFLPAMFLSWAIIGGALWWLEQVFNASKTPPYGLIYTQGGGFLFALIGLIFAGIFLAGWVIYAFIIRSTPLSNYAALSSGRNKTDPQYDRLDVLLKLHHKVRNRELSTVSKFSAETFLKQFNRTYFDINMRGFFGSMAIVVALAFFDLRFERSFYDDHLVTSGGYFSLSPKRDVAYDDITHIVLRCRQFNSGHPSASYRIYSGTKKPASISINRMNLFQVGEVDEVLRQQSHIRFEYPKDKNGKQEADPKCISEFGKDMKAPRLVRNLLAP